MSPYYFTLATPMLLDATINANDFCPTELASAGADHFGDCLDDETCRIDIDNYSDSLQTEVEPLGCTTAGPPQSGAMTDKPVSFHHLSHSSSDGIPISSTGFKYEDKDADVISIQLQGSAQSTCTIMHDGQVHNPLGAGGYVWEKAFFEGLLQDWDGESQLALYTDSKSVLTTVLAFRMASALAPRYPDANVHVLIDTDEPPELVKRLSNDSGIPYHTAPLKEIPATGIVLQSILCNYKHLAHKPSISSSCPSEGCSNQGLIGEVTSTHDDIFTSLEQASTRVQSLHFHCPVHGAFSRSLDDFDHLHLDRLTLQLVKTILYSGTDLFPSQTQPKVTHIQVLPASQSGTSNEQQLWAVLVRLGIKPPIIVYAPSIVDWAGSPLELDETLSEAEMKNLAAVVDTWIAHPTQLFRYWSYQFLKDFVLDAPDDTIIPLPPLQNHTYESEHDGLLMPSPSSTFQFVPTVTKSLGDASKKSLIIRIGAQPNNSPHTGTITVFASAFARAKQIRDADPSIDVTVSLDLVDTAPDSSKTMDLDGVKYQQSHRATAAMNKFLPDYEELMVGLSAHFGGVKWRKMFQQELMDTETVPAILCWVIGNHAWLGPRLAPQRKKLCIRSACPQKDCAWADKHGINTTFFVDGEVINSDATFVPPSLEECLAIPPDQINTSLQFVCPYHGKYVVDLNKKEDVRRLEFNTPLRNLVRTIAQGLHTRSVRSTSDASVLHMRVTGADYSGMYQERLLWSVLLQLGVPIDPPMVVYAPLIVDWAGSKLSKSLYVKKGAYRYLEDKDMHYLLSYDNMKAMKKDPMALARMIEGLLDDEGKMERPYSIDYIHDFVFGG